MGRARWMVLALVLAACGAAAGACNIQPQPLPPGAPSLAGDGEEKGGGANGSDSAAPGRTADAGSAATSGDAGADANGTDAADAAPPPAEGGDGGDDAADGGTDAPLG